MKKFLYLWVLVSITIVCGLVYVLAQQTLRSQANDPQIQMAEDNAALLAAGGNVEEVNVGTQKIDISKSLSPFTMVLNADGGVLASNAFLDGSFPQIPQGVLEAAKAKGENRITWQPQGGTRIALVVSYIQADKGGFVAVGRNLREVEKREQSLLTIALLGWGLLLVTSFAAIWLLSIDRSKL